MLCAVSLFDIYVLRLGSPVFERAALGLDDDDTTFLLPTKGERRMGSKEDTCYKTPQSDA